MKINIKTNRTIERKRKDRNRNRNENMKSDREGDKRQAKNNTFLI